ncbi:MAG: DUF72 domain-containing protein [Rudaea sp.]|nr:DUF72 domain-containing protein [Rudaea sp.]
MIKPRKHIPEETCARVGCAGWAVPKTGAAAFPLEGSHLKRYAARFNCVEINSSFYRSHRPATYERWAETVPVSFRFSVKLPRTITHHARLAGVSAQLDAFFAGAGALGDKLGWVLVQLPPSLRFETSVTQRFLAMLRRRYAGRAAIEPRHPTWFMAIVDRLLVDYRVARVAADPAVVPAAAAPGGDLRGAYFRLHGSPEIYYSTYDSRFLAARAKQVRALAANGTDVWCIFDNTALGAATSNALEVMRRLVAAT